MRHPQAGGFPADAFRLLDHQRDSSLRSTPEASLQKHRSLRRAERDRSNQKPPHNPRQLIPIRRIKAFVTTLVRNDIHFG